MFVTSITVCSNLDREEISSSYFFRVCNSFDCYSYPILFSRRIRCRDYRYTLLSLSLRQLQSVLFVAETAALVKCSKLYKTTSATSVIWTWNDPRRRVSVATTVVLSPVHWPRRQSTTNEKSPAFFKENQTSLFFWLAGSLNWWSGKCLL